MNRKARAQIAALCAMIAVCAHSLDARATGFTDLGQDLDARQKLDIRLSGYARTRVEGLYNLDLDRGLTPSGEPLFPVSSGISKAQLFTHGDMRFRTDLAVVSPFGGMAAKLRVDLLDNVAFGSAPDGIPSASTSQRAGASAIRIRRAYTEILTPIGLLATGRMGASWGLGMLVNGGDCLDCDSGDSSDRIAFMMPLAGHIVGLAFDFGYSGPLVERRSPNRMIGFEPSTAVRSLTLALLKHRDDLARKRRSAAGKYTLDYGVYGSYRYQTDDAPTEYLPLAGPKPARPVLSARGFEAFAVDGFFRLLGPWIRVEAEVAYLSARVEQPSLLPGVTSRDSATSRQLGMALESEVSLADNRYGFGIDAGYASGDSAPGFGAQPGTVASCPKAGDLDGPQACLPRDTTVNNFRFHPDYRVDRILFREIVGTVTDAAYVRPHFRADLVRYPSGKLQASVAAIASFAMEATSAPGGKAPLGIEVDPSLTYTSRDGLVVALDHAVLFPLEGLDNIATGLRAKPAQLLRLRIVYAF